MLKRPHTRHATRGTIPYLAGEYLHKNGPVAKEELFVAVAFGSKPHKRQDALDRAIQSAWLIETLDGRIACSTDARLYYDSLEAKPGNQPAGETVQPQFRGDWRTGTLSRQHIPNRRGLRPASDAAPAWSVKPSGYGIKSIGGGE